MNKLNTKDMEKKAQKRWSKSESNNDGGKDITVREIENGYIIEIHKWSESEEDGYKSTNKEIYSKTNPIEEKDPEKEDVEFSLDSLKDMF